MRSEDLLNRIHQLLLEPAVTGISPSAYDTAAVAVLWSTSDDRSLLFPSAAEWLLRNQNADGSWAHSITTPHDSVVSTLAAVVALAELAASPPEGFPDVTSHVAKGTERLWQLFPEVRADDPRETIGFEFIVPNLLAKARALGLRLPYADLEWVENLYQRKMSVVPPGAFDRVTTLVHSLETFGDKWPGSGVSKLMAPDGSYGCSPAATVCVYRTAPSPASASYLATAIQATGEGAAPTIYRYRTFDEAWTFHAFAMAGLAPSVLRPHVARLLPFSVMGFGPSAGLPRDADDTGTALQMLAYSGYPVELDMLRDFETPDGYVTFELERGFSVSTNVHVLGALILERARMAKQIRTVLRFLRERRVDGAYWYDKWHLSPLYSTCHAIPVLDGTDDRLCADAVSWVLETQNADGSWGLGGGTLEESGYALNALMAVSQSYPQVRGAVRRGVSLVAQQYRAGETGYPPLWIGKVNYSPYRVIEAAILGALYHATRLPWAADALSGQQTLAAR